jgi:hypothetical protein
MPVMAAGSVGSRLFAPASVGLARRFGARASITLALASIGLLGVARALVPSAAGVILT